MQIHVGHPDGKCRVLLEQCLSAVDVFAEPMADGTSDAELYEADDEREQRDEQQQRRSRLAVDNVLHRDARRDGQRESPAVETEIRHADNAVVESRQRVLHQPTEHQRQHEDRCHLLKNDEEGRPEADMHRLFEQREDKRNHQSRRERRDDREGGHGGDVAAELSCDDRSRRGRRCDDAREHGFPQNLLASIALHTEDDGHIDRHEQQLCHENADVPTVRTHLMEVNLAEGDEERTENRQRKDEVDDGSQLVANLVEGRYPEEDEIENAAHGNGHGQRPVFQKPHEGITSCHPSPGCCRLSRFLSAQS